MDIAKVIKAYFAFLLIIVSCASLTYNHAVRYYMASVLTGFDALTEQSVRTDAFDLKELKIPVTKNVRQFTKVNSSRGSLSFDVFRGSAKPFAFAGENNVELFRFEIKNTDGELVFRSLTLEIVGIDAKYIDKFVLTDQENIIAGGRIIDNTVVFDSIDYDISTNSNLSFSVRADLSAELQPGNRIRLDLVAPEDVVMIVDGERYFVNGYYPINGSYLSIAKEKPESLKWELPAASQSL